MAGQVLSSVWDLQEALLDENSRQCLTYLGVDAVVLKDTAVWNHFIITLSKGVVFSRVFHVGGGGGEVRDRGGWINIQSTWDTGIKTTCSKLLKKKSTLTTSFPQPHACA